ncbi:MAG: hypothetical protein GWO07_13670 [Candidatus Dadabacteria bacterium]|nr:hypothetical protein [Candidatus Dadabacteria bacterium]NIS09773.1 hypothetical protein [Candidatus Dadabacteria bacterium]NIY22541.1 hypothetical protein [Candidatus Dadabacteria bacterium]
MPNLEESLDKEVIEFIGEVEQLDEYKALHEGTISDQTYIRFLKTFYIMESISADAVNKASRNTRESDPYLSQRFDFCAEGERGHAEIALKDLSDMGVAGVDTNGTGIVTAYNDFLQKGADELPAQIVGHSYIFETASAVLFPKQEITGKPKRFAEVHAKEDPGHSQAIRRTVRKIEPSLSTEEKQKIVSFSKQSGRYFIDLFSKI